MASIWFAGNYEDLSTDRGYRFKFRCDKCGTEAQGDPKFCPECGQKYA